MEKDDKGSTMIRMGVSGWMFLLVPVYPGCPRSKAVKRSLFLVPAHPGSPGQRPIKWVLVVSHFFFALFMHIVYQCIQLFICHYCSACHKWSFIEDLLVTSHPGQLCLPSVGGELSTSQTALMPCGRDVKAGWLIPLVGKHGGAILST